MRKNRDNRTRFKKESEQARKDEQKRVRRREQPRVAVDTIPLRKAIHRAHRAGTSIDDLAKRTKWEQKKIREVLADTSIDISEPE